MLAAIPYQTFPEFELGPITIRTFGMLVGIGVALGAWMAARELERRGIDRDETYRLAIRMVIWGVIGSRVTWVLSHLDQIDSPIDLIALWEGGIQFSGGFVAAVIAGYPTFRKWSPRHKFRAIDGYAYGLTIGLAIGRLGCYSVGEHLGSATSFFLGTRYEGGDLQEPTLDGTPVVEGLVFHQTALYEFFHLLVLFGFLSYLLYVRRDRTKAGTIIGIFCIWYGIGRFLTDALRVNDNRVLGLTGAQWMCVALVPIGIYLLTRSRRGDYDEGEIPQTVSVGAVAGEATSSASSEHASSEQAPSEEGTSEAFADDAALDALTAHPAPSAVADETSSIGDDAVPEDDPGPDLPPHLRS